MDKEEQKFPSEGSGEEHTEKAADEERAAKDLEKSSLAEGAPNQLGRQQDNAGRVESQEEDDKGLLDKMKDKLKGE